jgi:hypothetical protein
MTKAKARERVDVWNVLNPIGTEVVLRLPDASVRTKTGSVAIVSPAWQPLVWIDTPPRQRGWHHLDSVLPA